MFEIGNSLHEARVRQGLELAEVEQATKIRGKYLRALEDEQFERLPGQTYVKGFLRTYAEYLGLDGQLYVDEFNSRHVAPEDETPFKARPTKDYGRSYHLESNAVVIALTAIGLATALVVAAWQFGNPGDRQDLFSPPAAAPETKAPARPKAKPAARLALRALHGNSFVKVHLNSATGQLLYEGTLERGRRQFFIAKRLWFTAGAPANLSVRLNRKELALPGKGAPRSFVVTRQGISLSSF